MRAFAIKTKVAAYVAAQPPDGCPRPPTGRPQPLLPHAEHPHQRETCRSHTGASAGSPAPRAVGEVPQPILAAVPAEDRSVLASAVPLSEEIYLMMNLRDCALATTVLGMIAVCPAVARAVNVPVFILAGQSNMDGRGHTSDIPGIRPTLNVTQSSPGDSVEISYDGYQSSGTFAWMAPGNSGGAEGAGGANEFGCELSLGQGLAEYQFPNQTVYLIKVSQGGTTLAGDWKPGTGANDLTGCGGDWSTLVSYTNAALATIKAAGNTPVIEGFFWHQGESDGQALTNAQNYDANLRAFMADVRGEFSAYAAPNMPFFVGSMGNITNGSYPYDNTYIYNAEKSVSMSLGTPGGINYTQRRQYRLRPQRLRSRPQHLLRELRRPGERRPAFYLGQLHNDGRPLCQHLCPGGDPRAGHPAPAEPGRGRRGGSSAAQVTK